MTSSDDHVLDHVDPFLHDVLEPDEAARVAAHCEACPICRVALDEARKRYHLLQTLPTIEAGDSLLEATEQRIDGHVARGGLDELSLPKRIQGEPPSRRFWLIGGGILAAITLLLGLFHVHLLNLEPTPYDLQVLGQQDLLPGTESSLRVLVFNRADGVPLARIPVVVELAAPDDGNVIELASFETDARGTGSPRIHIPESASGDYELRVRARMPGGWESIAHAVRITRSWQVMLSTDKPVYQPGQTIHVRSLSLRQPDRRPVTGEQASFRITDPRGNVIFQERSVTSRFGICATDCALAEELIEGDYTIECTVGDTTGRATVEVRKYVLPKFRIDVELDRPYYAPGDALHGDVTAEYFFGQAVAAGEIKVEIAMTDLEPRTLRTFLLETDADGNAAFDFRLPQTLFGREQEAGDARIAITVSVTDSAGQSQSRDVSCTVTSRPLRLEVIPEAGELVRGVENTVYLLTTYADGSPARVRNSVYGIDHELESDGLGVTEIQLTPTSALYDLTVTARDEAGVSVTKTVSLNCNEASDAFVLRTDRAVYAGGDTLELAVIGGGVQPVFVDFLKDDQTLLTESVDVKDGRGELVLDLPAELSGTVELCAYRYAEQGLPVRQRRVIYVEPASELRIETKADQPEYRPGETANLEFRLVDSAGRPAPGAISLAAVDEAVFSVLNQRPGMEQTFFTLDQELLEPVYAIYSSSQGGSAVPADVRDRFQQALFSRTAERKTVSRQEVLDELLPYVDNNPAIFEVLDRPDWKLLIGDWVPPEFISRLEAADAEYSLMQSSFPAKRYQVETDKRRGIEVVKKLWKMFGGVIALCIVVGVVIYLNRIVGFGELIFLLLVICVLLALLLQPGVQQAREAARRTQAASEVRNVVLAMENFIGDTGRLPGELPETIVSSSPAPRVREWFPETLLWRPELITDDQGRATLEVPLADSITTWRLTASAVTADGRLGGAESDIRVFQPFFVDLNLPVSFTRGDEVTLPVVVYNYLDEPQTVTINVETADWFELPDESERTLDLEPGAVESVGFRIRLTHVGDQELQVSARSAALADAIRRRIEVVPDGRRVEQVNNGSLEQPAAVSLDVPEEAIEGSVRAVVKVYPSTLSQLVEGLDGIFQRPYGCFEQTSSTTYPNVLALQYLRDTQQNVPAVEATALQYIHLGYQRLLTFEVGGGGFDWFGRPPANRTLTAYGLMEFEDMAQVHDVDPQLIDRTREWLLAQRRRDGSWDPEGHAMHDIDLGRSSDAARLRTTAYIAWAVFGGRGNDAQADATRHWLTTHAAYDMDDPYTLALLCNALLAIDGGSTYARPYLDRLLVLRQRSADGKLVWWGQEAGWSTMFYGSGRAGDVETTAIAALAFLSAPRHVSGVDAGSLRITAHRALAWIATQRDAVGTWHSTQATVLALKALLTGTGRPAAAETDRHVQLVLDDTEPQEIVIPAWQSELVQTIDLSDRLTPGPHTVRLTDRTDVAPAYQVSLAYHVPGESPSDASAGPLAIDIEYDRRELDQYQTVTATARVRSQSGATLPMVVLDLPIPPGFTVDPDEFQSVVGQRQIEKFQVTPRSVIVYLRSLAARVELQISYNLRATLPVVTTTEPAVAFEYYTPEHRAESGRDRLTVRARD